MLVQNYTGDAGDVVSNWNYPESDLAHITHTLGTEGSLSPEQLQQLTSRIVEAAPIYKYETQLEGAGRTPTAIMTEIQLLEKAVASLQHWMEQLPGDVQTKLEIAAKNISQQPADSALQQAAKALSELHPILHTAAAVPIPMGRPPKLARKRFIAILEKIWIDAHAGANPTRRYFPKDAHGKGREYGPFLDFVRACVMPIDGHAKSVVIDIRYVLSGKKVGP